MAGKEISMVVAPGWVDAIVKSRSGSHLRLLAEKKIEQSDLTTQQNRFRIPADQVRRNILPMLSEDEIHAASLDGPEPCKKKATELPETKKRKTTGRKHEGLELKLYNGASWWFQLYLTRWDSNGSTVLKGKEWNYVRVFSGLDIDDRVRVWGFRDGDGKLCMVLDRQVARSSGISCWSKTQP